MYSFIAVSFLDDDGCGRAGRAAGTEPGRRGPSSTPGWCWGDGRSWRPTGTTGPALLAQGLAGLGGPSGVGVDALEAIGDGGVEQVLVHGGSFS